MGTLYLVGTPIGNLDDITLRAVATLREVPRVAAEDTRRTRALLSHLGIRGKALQSLDANATESAIERAIQWLCAGEDTALVTDAGMPSISDPGARLVQQATARGIPVVVVPGPSAVTAAIAASGLVESTFLFAGFLPRKGEKRRSALRRLAATPEPIVLFEAPGRTHETLEQLAVNMPQRPVVVCRELTKLHEEIVRGTVAAVATREDWRGEVVLVLGPAPGANAPVRPHEEEQIAEIRRRLAKGQTSRELAGELAALWHLPRRAVYALALRVKSETSTPG